MDGGGEFQPTGRGTSRHERQTPSPMRATVRPQVQPSTRRYSKSVRRSLVALRHPG